MRLKWSAVPWVCFAMCVGVMGTALISPLYPLYQTLWSLRTSEVSLLYIVYMLGALVGLLFMGRLADSQGFRPVMLFGLALGWGGTLLSMLSWDLGALGAARFAVGLSSSLIVTSASVGLMQVLRTRSPQYVSTLTSFLLAFGFGLGPISGGLTAQWLPQPLVTTYIPTLLLGVLAIYGLLKVHTNEPGTAAAFRWQALAPRLTWPERRDTFAFVLTCCCPFFAFGVFGLYASMSPLFIDKMLPWHGPAVSGCSIGVILMMSAAVQLLSARLSLHWCGSLGLLAVVLSNALLVFNFQAMSVAMFAVGVLAAAVGHGLCLLAGISMVNRIASPAQRAGLISTYLVSGYVGSIAPLLGAGWLADHFGLQAAITALGLGVVATALPAGVAFLRHPRMRND